MYLSGLGVEIPADGSTSGAADATGALIAIPAYPSPQPVYTPAPAPLVPPPAISVIAVAPPVAGAPMPVQPTPTYLPYGIPVTLASGAVGYSDGNGGVISGPVPSGDLPVSTAPSMSLIPASNPMPPAPVVSGVSDAATLPTGINPSGTTLLLLGAGILGLMLFSRKRRP